MLEHKCQKELQYFKKLLNEGKTIVFLDYDTNENEEDASKPLSHASLIKDFLNN
jgi:hypothetical protein